MTQLESEKTRTQAGGKKLTLRKETLRDLQAPESRIQRINGGRGLSQDTNTGDQCTYRVSGCA